MKFNGLWKVSFLTVESDMLMFKLLTFQSIFGLSFQDSELQDLRETIEVLKVKNTEAQSIIQGALNVPETTPKGIYKYIYSLFLCIRLSSWFLDFF